MYIFAFIHTCVYLIQSINTPLTESQLDDLIQMLDDDGNGDGYLVLLGPDDVVEAVGPVCDAEFQALTLAGDYAGALKMQDRLMPLHDAIFMEPGVNGAKHGLSKLGRMSDVVRSPLLPVSKITAAAIDKAMADLGLI